MIFWGTGGALGKVQNQMPKTMNAEVCRKIKQIASMASINTPATENGVTAPKWTFVRTHTARRSAATNLAMGGATLDFICKLGGWKKLGVLKKYLLASGLDVAKVAVVVNFLGNIGLKLKKSYFTTSI
ncbi:hypothetical protein [Haliscomenobacter sp.]|uniref:hypothetical protein n=1 Tax=Haliscomenobacter sp. TaxID=2717303 RepID=UPI003BABE578